MAKEGERPPEEIPTRHDEPGEPQQLPSQEQADRLYRRDLLLMKMDAHRRRSRKPRR